MQRGLIFGLGAAGLIVAIGLTLAASAFADHGLQAGGDTIIVAAVASAPGAHAASPVARQHSSSMGSAGRADKTKGHRKPGSHGGNGGQNHTGSAPSPAPPAGGSSGVDDSNHVDGDD